MGDVLKVLAISFLVLAAITAAGNYYYGAGGCIQVINVSENNPDSDRFVAVTSAYDDRLEFSYILREAGNTGDYYATYNITAEGNTVVTSERELYGNVSPEEPVTLVISRVNSSLYEMEMLIEDTQGNVAHRSIIRVSPQKQ